MLSLDGRRLESGTLSVHASVRLLCHDLDEVAAGVVEDGHDGGSHVRRRSRDQLAAGREPAALRRWSVPSTPKVVRDARQDSWP